MTLSIFILINDKLILFSLKIPCILDCISEESQNSNVAQADRNLMRKYK